MFSYLHFALVTVFFVCLTFITSSFLVFNKFSNRIFLFFFFFSKQKQNQPVFNYFAFALCFLLFRISGENFQQKNIKRRVKEPSATEKTREYNTFRKLSQLYCLWFDHLIFLQQNTFVFFQHIFFGKKHFEILFLVLNCFLTFLRC